MLGGACTPRYPQLLEAISWRSPFGYGLKNCVLMCFSFCFPSNLQLKHLKRKTSLLCLSDVQNFHRNKKCHEVSLNVSYVALWLSERMETYLSVQ